MTVRLECTTGGHNKFWTITIENEQETEVTYGAIGAKPRLSHKDHGSAEKAKQFKEKMITSKKKKGYVDAKADDGAATAEKDMDKAKKGLAESQEKKAVAEGDLEVTSKARPKVGDCVTTLGEGYHHHKPVGSRGTIRKDDGSSDPFLVDFSDCFDWYKAELVESCKAVNDLVPDGRRTKSSEDVEEAAKATEPKEPEPKKAKVDSVSSTTHLEMTTGGHHKFWEIRVDGVQTTVSYGAICYGGIPAAPRKSVKTHGSAADAQKFMVKMIGSKKREGYTDTSEDGGGSSGGSPAAQAATTSGSTPAPHRGGSENTLYTFGSRVSAHELEKRRDDWQSNEVEDVCMKDVKHGIMSEAPAIAKASAEELNSSMPDLEDTFLGSGEGSDGGEVIVISCSGTNSKDACVAGLKFTDEFVKEYGKEAKLEKVDFHKLVKYGFNMAKTPGYSETPETEMEERLEDDPEGTALFIAGTKIMAAKLKNHFVFGFSEEVTSAPLIYGGFASDGNIVGVLSSRVMT